MPEREPILGDARAEAVRLGHDRIGVEHLLLALARRGVVPDPARVAREIESRLPPAAGPPGAGQLPFAPAVKEALRAAFEEAGGPVGDRHLLRGLLRVSPLAREVLRVPAGILLAAGGSTRMGSPKALLRFGGRTALELAAAALRGGGCEPVAVVTGAGAAELPVPSGCRRVGHPGWESGRSGTLKAGLRALPAAPALVVLPVDHPLVTAEDVRALVAAWRADRPPVVRPVRNGRGGHPVLLDGSLRAELLALGDDEPLRDLLRAHRDLEVTVPGSPGTLVNVDTPEDYRAALALHEEARSRAARPDGPPAGGEGAIP